MTYKDPDKQRDFQRAWARQRRFLRKQKVVALLGGQCARCGYKDHIEALQVDHILPTCRTRAERFKTTGHVEYKKILDGVVSIGDVQLLCANCHAIKTFGDRVVFKNYRETKTVIRKRVA